jgi:anti-sigma regulatory factor (Ser/Thr protein kinase)
MSNGMARASRQNPAVREFILRNVKDQPTTIAATTAQRFGLSRVTVASYLRRLIADGLLKASGTTRARRYDLAPLVTVQFSERLTAGLSEDAIWRFRILPELKALPPNVRDMCQYGFTEIFNNAIDHSASKSAGVSIEQTYSYVRMAIIDQGVGIFNKIQHDHKLADRRQALLELSKGRLTSNRKNHSGQGIYFTSRMFDEFAILSGALGYTCHHLEDDEWLVEVADKPETRGTGVYMVLSTAATWTMQEIFTRAQGDGFGFRRTHFPIHFGQYPGEQLVSRSQARRVMARVENFSEALLDFKGVDQIGPAFADEIFRVFHNAHPEVDIVAVRTTPAVKRVIAAVERD